MIPQELCFYPAGQGKFQIYIRPHQGVQLIQLRHALHLQGIDLSKSGPITIKDVIANPARDSLKG